MNKELLKLKKLLLQANTPTREGLIEINDSLNEFSKII